MRAQGGHPQNSPGDGDVTESATVSKREHTNVEVIRSQPGLGVILGVRVLAAFGDAYEYADAKAPAQLLRDVPDNPSIRDQTWPSPSLTLLGGVMPGEPPCAGATGTRDPAPTDLAAVHVT